MANDTNEFPSTLLTCIPCSKPWRTGPGPCPPAH